MAFSDSFGIERELDPGERLLWKGRPQRGIKFKWQDWIVLPFGLVFCGVVLLLVVQTVRNHLSGKGQYDLIHDLVVTVSVLFVFYMAIGRYLFDAYARSKMEYALTDRRALILTNTFRRKVRSFDYRAEPNILLSERRNGSGTIYFGEKPQGEKTAMSSGSVLGFDMIDNAHDVYQRILKAKEA